MFTLHVDFAVFSTKLFSRPQGGGTGGCQGWRGFTKPPGDGEEGLAGRRLEFLARISIILCSSVFSLFNKIKKSIFKKDLLDIAG